MKNYKKILTLLSLLFSSFIYCDEGEADPNLHSISEALKSPYEYQSVNVITGEYCESETDISLRGPAPLDVKRYYTSQDPIAQGWHFNHSNILYGECQIPEEWIPEPYHYSFDSQNRLTGISVKSSEEDIFNSLITIDYAEGEHTICRIESGTSKEMTYTFEKYPVSRAAHPYVLTQVKDNNGWEVNYHYTDHPRERRQLLKRRDEPNGRFLETEYYDSTANKVGNKIVRITDPNRDPRIGKVKLQRAPVGVDQTPVITNCFFYEPGYTDVFDALGNRTSYRYGKQNKLIAIEHYWDEQTLYRKERIFWDAAGQMTSRTIEDGSGTIHLCHSYSYDSYGNVIKTTIWGNLSGNNASPLQIAFDGQPVETGVESFSTYYTYSEDGQHLLEEAADNGSKTLYVYQGDQLAGKFICNDEGIKIRRFYTYDAAGNVIEEIEDDGFSLTFEDLSGVTERHFTRIEVKGDAPAKGKPVMIESGYFDLQNKADSLLTKAILSYSPEGHLIHKTVYDAELKPVHEITYDYDIKGNLIQTFDSLGSEQTIAYDLHGNMIKQTDNDTEIRQTFDFANRLIKKETWKNGQVKQLFSYRYDFVGHPTVCTDHHGNETCYDYDPMGRLVKTTLPAILNGNDQPIYPAICEKYDIFNRVVQTTDPKGYTTKTCYNAWGKPIAVTNPDGSKETFEYYLDGSLRKKTAQSGLSTIYHRDFLSRVVKEDHFDQEMRLIGEKTYEFTPYRLLSETSIDGNVTRYAYDSAGRQTSLTKGDNYRLEITYDAAGQIASKKEWYGEDQNDYVLGVIERDEKQDVIAMAVQNSRGEILRHHELKRKEQEKPEIFDNEHFYNSLGQNVLLRTEVNAKGEILATIFDALNRPVSIVKKNALGKMLSHKEIRYDPSGNKEKETYSVLKGEKETGVYVLSWCWGPNNRLESLTEGFGTPLARTTTYFYNSKGLLEKTVKPDQVSLTFHYNCNGDIETLASSDESINYRYFYDEMGRIIQVLDKNTGAATQRTYDQSGQMVAENLANGLTLAYDYDYLGRLRYLTLPDQSGIQRQYNAAFLTDVSRVSSKGDTLYTHSYTEFDLQGRLLKSDLIDNLGTLSLDYKEQQLSAIHSPYWNQCFAFNDCHLLTSLTTEDPIGTVTHRFEYDDLDQVTEEIGLDPHSFSYDSLGNFTSMDGCECSVDSLNQLQDAGSRLMDYDLNGQLVECWNDGRHYLYQYDALGRLITAIKDKECRLTFTYDPFGRRLSKTISDYRAKERSYLERSTEYYLWEGENEIGTVNEQGEITQLRVLGSGLGAEIGAAVAIELGSKRYAPIHDHRGNVCCLIDGESKLPVEWYHYSAYGREIPYSLQYKPVGNPWRFSSKRVDDETGLVYFGKRYYMPSIGRWITKDPLGTPESVNRYAYSLNQPLARIDPYGLFSFGDLWRGIMNFGSSAYRYSNLTINSLKNHLNFDDYIRPAVGKIGELILGKTLLQLSGFYQDASEMGVHGQGELNDKVRITLINGILNARGDYKKSLDILSDSHGGMNIHYLFDATGGWTNDMLRAFLSRMGYISPTSHQLADMWRELIDEMGGVGEGGLIIHYAHSIGATHTKNALSLLSPEERAMIRVYTFGAPSTINDPSLESVKNFISYRDGVPLLDPIGFFSGLLGLSDTVAMVGSPWGIPFIEHTLNGGAYYDIIRILGIHFMKHYIN
jgi:RHS repeat-associated protein